MFGRVLVAKKLHTVQGFYQVYVVLIVLYKNQKNCLGHPMGCVGLFEFGYLHKATITMNRPKISQLLLNRVNWHYHYFLHQNTTAARNMERDCLFRVVAIW